MLKQDSRAAVKWDEWEVEASAAKNPKARL